MLSSLATGIVRWGRKHWPDELFVGAFAVLALVEFDALVLLRGFFTYPLLSRVPIALAGMLVSFYILFTRIRSERGATLTPYQARIARKQGVWSFGYGFTFVAYAVLSFVTSPTNFIALVAPYPIALIVGTLLWLTDKVQRQRIRVTREIGPDNVAHATTASPSSQNLRWGGHTWSTVLMVVLLVALIAGSSAWFVKSFRSIVPIYTFTQQDHDVRTIAWSPDGTRIATGDGWGDVQIWGAFDGSDMVSFNLPIVAGYSDPPSAPSVRSLAWSTDGKELAVCPDAGGPTIWDAKRGVRIATLDASNGGCSAIAWSPDGKHLAADDNGIRLWDTTFSSPSVTLSTADSYDTSLAWSADDTRLAVATDSLTEVIDVSTRKTLWTTKTAQPDGPLAQALTWFAGSSRVAFAGAYLGDHGGGNYYNYVEVRTLNADTGAVLTDTRKTASGDETLAWSPGRVGRAYLAVGQEDEIVCVWQAPQLAESFTWHGQLGIPGAIAWSPDGTYVASGDLNNAVQVWRPDIGG